MRAWLRAVVSLAGLALALAAPLRAQLFSPGKLAAPHADLEGIRNCTSCHQLRQRGTSNALCLDCHKPLGARVAAGTGFHATVSARNCAECHRDHLGVDHPLVAFDTATFVHDTTGFRLDGAHRALGCRKCHTPDLVSAPDVKAYAGEHHALDRTFLGLPTTCVGCHASDSPHGTQFEKRDCDACHTAGDWKKADRFDHDRATFQLTGRHRTVACASCHPSVPVAGAKPMVRFAGIRSETCSDCHKDPHQGVMTGVCTACHNTDDWHRVAQAGLDGRFDHGRTRYPLTGAHARVKCAVCHNAQAPKPDGIRITWAAGTERTSFPHPTFATCLSCHVDRHEGAFTKAKGGAACGNCHGGEGWIPTTYDIARHNSEARFKLTGAHLAVPCNGCHAGNDPARATVFRISATDCASCHRKDDPHNGQFAGRACDSCHETASFAIQNFDHSRTRYPLDGAHRTVPCVGCHWIETPPGGRPFRRYTGLKTTCRDCHGGT